MATRLLLVGGFLGAGKTTLLLQTARLLAAQGYRVGIVTNDQAKDLVDTALVRSANIPVQEVAGGCFCCRFPDLLVAIERLQESVNPDVILGEPVGSCTDLVSTIFRPLHAYYPTRLQVAPLTVLIDPQRDPQSFPDEVGYIYNKQLAEANIIALNKSDLFDVAILEKKVSALRDLYPTTPIITLSAKTGAGLSDWLDTCLKQASNIEHLLELDYDIYAQGEAYLGWLNARGRLTASQPFSSIELITRLLGAIEQGCAMHHASVAHVKLHLTTSVATHKASLTQLGSPITWDVRPNNTLTHQAEFILNARVSTDPPTLEELVRQALAGVAAQVGIHADITEIACFSPLPPRPTYRLLQV
jgi:G3E family GTPase